MDWIIDFIVSVFVDWLFGSVIKGIRKVFRFIGRVIDAIFVMLTNRKNR